MLRFPMACMALLLAPLAAAEAKELKPKFGDIGGVFYTEVSEDREACEQAIKNKIALCEQNTSFISNTLQRKYPGCLPIFREQARVCADHFRSEAYKCQGSGSVRIGDFTGFACTVTATVVEEGEEPEGVPGIAPADRWMQARTRTNVRSGPGTQYDKVGLLETGEKVHVTGEWLRIEGPDGSTAFVHGSLLVPPALQGRDAAAGLSPKCSGMSKGAECWLELADRPGCYIFDPYYSPPETATWSGACRDGVAVGQGARGWDFASGSGEATGTLARGKQHGRWVIRSANGNVYEGPFVDGKLHGHWVFRFANGTVREGPYVDGERHGRWITRHAGGGRLELDYRNDSSEGQPGVYITGSGERHQGRWSGKCFRDGDGYAWAASGGWDNCPNN